MKPPLKSLPYVNSYRDRTGKMRHYIRRPGHKRVALPGSLNSPEFMAAYVVAMAATPDMAPHIPFCPNQSAGRIYYLQDGDHVKIGFTTNWEKRRAAYVTYSARELTLLGTHPGTKADERALHKRFEKCRVSGEWFLCTETVMRHIQETTRERGSLNSVTIFRRNSQKVRKDQRLQG